ncbi:MAG: hypothetical protein IIB29_18175 [Chloroflexi bacterium]|nr:hypothetical protein [Chloroflexota bacterium]MCI0800221.1 hypothetical protein [Chloroflexota bacterium]MCI0860209.1 hypothetical protein [Chloroflexota bacterium]
MGSQLVDTAPRPTLLSPHHASDRLKRQIERLLDEGEQALTDQVRQVVRQRAREVLAFDPDNTNWTPRNVGQAGRYATLFVPPACG